jgi:hypothetical protein
MVNADRLSGHCDVVIEKTVKSINDGVSTFMQAVAIQNWRELALLGRAKAPFSRASVPPFRSASRVPAKLCAHGDALPLGLIEPPICDGAPFLFRWSLDMMQDDAR